MQDALVSPASLEEVERRFEGLSDITDTVAQVNQPYESDLDRAFESMESFIGEARGWELSAMDAAGLRCYLSHMSFHREIVAEIIAEARRVLLDDRRHYVKRLVNYHRDFSRWLSGIEKRYAA
ncbi:MAG: hypothetical protein K1X75_10815 [Leptospirales bacterium]|nr:hypothetical protein [Leptospirales bacterium]